MVDPEVVDVPWFASKEPRNVTAEERNAGVARQEIEIPAAFTSPQKLNLS